jgi:hypothetical protein
MQEFITAVREHDEGEEDLYEFKVDDREMFARPMSAGQLAMLSAMRPNLSVQTMGRMLNTFLNVFEEEDAIYFEDRLLDRNDDFELDNFMEIVNGYITYFSGKGSKQPSDFQQSAKSSGRASTARSRAKGSTSSASRSRASSTS